MSPRPATHDVIPGVAGISVGNPGTPLPSGWTWTPLQSVARLESGHTPSRKHPEYWDGDVPWVGLQDARRNHARTITDTAQKITEAGLANSAARWLPADTICLSRTASVGYVTRLGQPMATSQDFVNWICGEALLPDFLMYALLSEGEHILDFGKGTTHTTIYFPEVQAFHVCLPPLPEQRRIVENVDALLADVNAARDRLAKVPRLLKRFRQAVLAAACSGRLTEAWRRENPDVEPASLLAQEMVARHSAFETSRRGNAAEPTEEVHDLAADQFPESWTVCELLWLCEPGRPITYGILKPGPHIPDGVPYVRVADFPGDRLSLNEIKRTSREIAGEYRRSTLRKGDVLLSIRGTYGRVCRVPRALEGGNITQDTARLSLQESVDAEYLTAYLRSPSAQNRLRKSAKGVAVHGVNIGDVRALQIALPPRVEQREIVRRLEALFALADAIEQRVAAAALRAEKLPQAILSKAFRGELVPTEAQLAAEEGRDYETAEQLLARVKTDREPSSRPCPGRRSKAGGRRESTATPEAKTPGAKRGRPRQTGAGPVD